MPVKHISCVELSPNVTVWPAGGLQRVACVSDQQRDVAASRAGGVFGDEPLRLEAFELRCLARRRAPEWWLIDLARDDGALTKDQLYMPEQYVELFVSRGWRA